VLSSNDSGATYQWLDCGKGNEPIDAAVNQSFTAVHDGSYAVALTENGCTDTSACFALLGISQETETAMISIYPNPTQGSLVLNFGSGQLYKEIRLFNAVGQLVLVRKLTGEQRLEINMPDHPGVYHLCLASSNNKSKIFKVVKQ